MLINWSFYDNQEAMERNFLALCIPALLGGYGMIVILFMYTALQSEDEDRFYEEMNLDTGEIGMDYALNLQKEKIENYYQTHKLGYFAKGEDIFHDYLTDDIIFEKAMLEEIYEFPISTIISNNYYLVPKDERSFIYFQELLRQRILATKTKVVKSNFFLSRAKMNYFWQPGISVQASPRFVASQDLAIIYFYGNFNYKTKSLEHLSYYQQHLPLTLTLD